MKKGSKTKIKQSNTRQRRIFIAVVLGILILGSARYLYVQNYKPNHPGFRATDSEGTFYCITDSMENCNNDEIKRGTTYEEEIKKLEDEYKLKLINNNKTLKFYSYIDSCSTLGSSMGRDDNETEGNKNIFGTVILNVYEAPYVPYDSNEKYVCEDGKRFAGREIDFTQEVSLDKLKVYKTKIDKDGKKGEKVLIFPIQN